MPRVATNTGQVAVYRRDHVLDQWVQKGQDLNGEQGGVGLGYQLSLTINGLCLAVSATPYDKTLMGYCRVYCFDIHKKLWMQLGQDLVGDSVADVFGALLSLVGEDIQQLFLAVGSNVPRGESSYTRVFRYNTSTQKWEAFGSQINRKSLAFHPMTLSETRTLFVSDTSTSDKGGGTISIYRFGR